MTDTSTPAIHVQNITTNLTGNAPDGGFLGFNDNTTASIAQINAVCYSAGRVPSVTAATLAVTAAANGELYTVLNRAAGTAVTLPAATGSGRIYRFIIGTTITSNTTVIQTATTGSGDVMDGIAVGVASALVGFETASNTNTITFNGTTTGGIVGTRVELIDYASGHWGVQVRSNGSGTGATPFSHV